MTPIKALIMLCAKNLRDCFVGGECEGLNGEELVKRLMQMMDHSTGFKARLKDIDMVKQEMGDAYYMPWFVECYPDAFPSWSGEADPRVL